MKDKDRSRLTDEIDDLEDHEDAILIRWDRTSGRYDVIFSTNKLRWRSAVSLLKTIVDDILEGQELDKTIGSSSSPQEEPQRKKMPWEK